MYTCTYKKIIYIFHVYVHKILYTYVKLYISNRFDMRSVHTVYVNTILHIWEFHLCITFVYGIKIVSCAYLYLHNTSI